MGGLTITAVQSAASARVETRPSEFQRLRYAQSGDLGGPEGRENSRKRTAAKPLSVSVPRPAPAPPSAIANTSMDSMRPPPSPYSAAGSAASARPESAPAAPAPDPQTSSRVCHPESHTPTAVATYISSSRRDDKTYWQIILPSLPKKTSCAPPRQHVCAPTICGSRPAPRRGDAEGGRTQQAQPGYQLQRNEPLPATGLDSRP